MFQEERQTSSGQACKCPNEIWCDKCKRCICHGLRKPCLPQHHDVSDSRKRQYVSRTARGSVASHAAAALRKRSWELEFFMGLEKALYRDDAIGRQAVCHVCGAYEVVDADWKRGSEGTRCDNCSDGGPLHSQEDFTECGSFDLCGPYDAQSDVSPPSSCPTDEMTAGDRLGAPAAYEDTWELLTEDSGQPSYPQNLDSVLVGGARFDFLAEGLQEKPDGSLVRCGGTTGLPVAAQLSDSGAWDGLVGFRTEDLAFTKPVVTTQEARFRPRILADDHGVTALHGHGPCRIERVSDLYINTWTSTHHRTLMHETVNAQAAVKGFLDLVECQVINLVMPGHATEGRDVEFDMPIPLYPGRRVPPGCQIYHAPSEAWWHYIDGLTGSSGGPRLLCNLWLVPSGRHIRPWVHGSHVSPSMHSRPSVAWLMGDGRWGNVTHLGDVAGLPAYAHNADIESRGGLIVLLPNLVTTRDRRRGFVLMGQDSCIREMRRRWKSPPCVYTRQASSSTPDGWCHTTPAGPLLCRCR